MKVLVVEDDTLFGEMLAAILSNLNYVVEVAVDGEQAWNLIEYYEYDLILLDVLLPKIDGITLCRQIRARGLVAPILLVTGCNDSHEKAVGLNAGADDYVVKPFDEEELVARIHALLRRGVSSQPVLEHGELRLYPVSCEVTYRNEMLTLTPKEYGLLELFMRNSKRLFSCGMILEHLWTYDEMPGEEAVRTHIKGLRQKLKAIGAPDDLIETVYGIGYRLKALQKSKVSVANLKSKQKTLLAVSEIWEKYKGRVSEQVNTLVQAGLGLDNGELDLELRSKALQEAHTLAGSLASFGFPEGSKIAAQLEKLLKVENLHTHINDVKKFDTLVKALQQAIKPSSQQTPVIEPIELNEQAVAKILVVDDDPKIVAILETLLAPWGLKVYPLDNPERFHSSLAFINPDLVILDVQMPLCSGIELCQQVRNDSNWNDLPILFLTVHNDADIINQVFTVGADDFVSKPIVGPELVTRILNRLERSKLRRQHIQTELRQSNRMLKTLSACNQALLRAEKELYLLQNICRIITEVGNYQSVWVGLVDDTPNHIIPVVQAGNISEKFSFLAAKAIESIETCVFNEGTQGVSVAAISIPLISNSKAFGVINISANEPNAFNSECVKQLEQLTADLAYGIISLRQKQERTAELVQVNETLQCELERRFQMQEALRNSQALFAGIVSIADDAIISIDSNQCITLFNSGAEKIFGYLASEVLGKPLDLLLPQRYTQVHRRHVTEFKQSPNTSRKMAERREIYGVRKDGTEFPAEASISKLELADDIVYTVYLQDVSDRKQIERMKNEFISVVSHELRTPLTSIHGSLGMLASGLMKPDSEQSQRLLQIATDSTERLVRLINDVLDIERIESGRVKMSKQICDAGDLINEAVNVIQPLADRANIRLSVTRLSINVRVDPDRIVQTLTNLFNNAIKFSKPDTTVELEVQKRNKEVLFIIKDNGRGIRNDKLEVIFERFQQLDASDARRQDGTGLGLAICKSIVQQHNGQIWAESILGEGSTFYFTIPLE